jgi:hypothetical protein
VRYHGAKFVYELQPGEDWIVSCGSIVVTHPDRPAKVVNLDGTVEEIKP